MNALLRTVFVMLLMTSARSNAVHVNPDGTGEVLLYPYYTVNNGFNTIYSVINTTAKAKAIKIRFLEGMNHIDVLEFNVYLSPYDAWTAVLTPTISTLQNHIGEPSVLHSSTDESCTPFLTKSGQEFLPFAIPFNDAVTSLERSTEGYLEVIEMGVVTGSSAIALQHDDFGVPDDCDQISGAWDLGYWSIDANQDMLPPSGGLTGSGVLLNVEEGHMMGYDAIAMNDFWQGVGVHTEPGSLVPNLDFAKTENLIQTDQGYQDFNWNFGYQAVSAALMKYSINNEYNLESFINARTDWILRWPTKNFHTSSSLSAAQPPFNELWDGAGACEPFSIMMTDSDTNLTANTSMNACFAGTVLSFQSNTSTANIFGSYAEALLPSSIAASGSEKGWAQITFGSPNQNMFDTNAKGIRGLPVVGFAAQRFTNAGAPVGVLSQYSQTLPHRHTMKTLTDLIYINGFE